MKAFDDMSKMAEVFGNTLIEIMCLTDFNCDEAPLKAKRALDQFGLGNAPKFKALMGGAMTRKHESRFWPNAGMRALQAQIDELWEMVKTLSTLFEDQRVGFVEAISHFNLSSAHDVLAKNWRKDL